MVRSGRHPCVSAVVLNLIGVVGVCVFAPAVRAGGCHVPDRPTFGMPPILESIAYPEDGDLHFPTYTPIPCNGETPGTVSNFVKSPPAHTAITLVIESPRPDSVLAISSSPSPLLFTATPPNRPPRALPV